MKKQFNYIIAFSILSIIISSCSTTNDVASHRGIQKRKYTKGFYISKNSNQAGKASEVKNAKVNNDLASDLQKKQHSLSNNSNNSEQLSKIETDAKVETTSIEQFHPSTQKALNVSEIKTIATNNVVKTETSPNPVKKIKSLKKDIKVNASQPASDVDTILLIILAILIPPLAVFLYEGASKRFWIDLILALLGWGFLGWLLPGAFFIGGLIAIIYALLIVTGSI